MNKIINNTMQPIMLEHGQILAAGETRNDIELTDTDRARHVPARITVIEHDERLEHDADDVKNDASKPSETVLGSHADKGEN